MRLLALAALAFMVMGCASQVVPTKAHQPTTADQVVIYQKAPGKYELLDPIRLVITPELKWNAAGDATPAFEQMKRKAAAMGANGLLLVPVGETGDFAVTAAYKGQYYQVQVKDNPRAALAQAIFVIQQ